MRAVVVGLLVAAAVWVGVLARFEVAGRPVALSVAAASFEIVPIVEFPLSGAAQCDLNGDAIVSGADSGMLTGLRGQAVQAGGLGDSIVDGVIALSDVAECQKRCTFAGCATS
jgi:hypothetical protein